MPANLYNAVVEKQKIESGFARVFGAQSGLPGTLVSVECDIVKGLHAFTIVGLPDKSVEEAKDRIAAAIKNSGLESPKRSNKKIVFSLAPAALKKEGAAFDIPIAIAFLLASEQIKCDTSHSLFAGELALDGSVRPITGALSIATVARENNLSDLYVPEENAEEVALVSGLRIIPIKSLEDLIKQLTSTTKRIYARKKTTSTKITEENSFDEIRGQEAGKRGLIIAASGAHNIALYGPPGTGKTLLARAIASILPDLDERETIEVTTIHSLAGALHGVMTRPPFRSPHHTSSYASLIGGSATPKPGEASLAHRGILFCDEFPEFRRDVIQALREPLEDRVVSVSRAKGSAIFPANFMLVAALNPCPCGHYGTGKCQCMPHVVEKYRRKISGPIADRIDMWVHVNAMPLERLSLQKKSVSGEGEKARASVSHARALQKKRFANTKLSTNTDMGPKEIESFAQLSKEAEDTLLKAASSLKLSARGFHRTIKLARTIADLAESESILVPHMLEALQYRAKDA